MLKRVKREINALASRFEVPEVFTISKVSKCIPDIANPKAPAGHVAIVGTKTYGLSGSGKMRPRMFLPIFHRTLVEEHNLGCFYYQTCHDLLNDLDRHLPYRLAVIPIYGEDGVPVIIPSSRVVRRIRELHPSCIFANHPDAAQVVRDKKATNSLLTRKGVPMPRMDLRVVSGKIFSNARFGTKRPAYVTDSARLDEARYNTEFIDTRYEVEGVEYYCSLRALAVGSVMLDLWPRFRPVEDGDPSVHSKDTPRSEFLLNKFYSEVALPLRRRAESICSKVKDALGLGFLALDILYDHDRDQLFVCEVGFKFADHTWVEHCGDLWKEVPWLKPHSSYAIARSSANAFAREVLSPNVSNGLMQG